MGREGGEGRERDGKGREWHCEVKGVELLCTAQVEPCRRLGHAVWNVDCPPKGRVPQLCHRVPSHPRPAGILQGRPHPLQVYMGQRVCFRWGMKSGSWNFY